MHDEKHDEVIMPFLMMHFYEFAVFEKTGMDYAVFGEIIRAKKHDTMHDGNHD